MECSLTTAAVMEHVVVDKSTDNAKPPSIYVKKLNLIAIMARKEAATLRCGLRFPSSLYGNSNDSM